MAQHVTTLNDIRTAQDPQSTPEMGDLLFANKGTGSDRDRAYTIGELLAMMNEHGVQVDAADTAPGYLADKLAKADPGTDGYGSGDVVFEPDDTRAGSHSVLKATIADKAVTSEKLADEIGWSESVSGGGKTSTKLDYTGVTVRNENTSGTTETTVEYDNVATPTVNAQKVVGTAAGTGAAGAKVLKTNAVHVGGAEDGSGNSKYLVVEGASDLKGDTTVGTESGPATLTVHGELKIDGGTSPQGGVTMDGTVTMDATVNLNGTTKISEQVLVAGGDKALLVLEDASFNLDNWGGQKKSGLTLRIFSPLSQLTLMGLEGGGVMKSFRGPGFVDLLCHDNKWYTAMEFYSSNA